MSRSSSSSGSTPSRIAPPSRASAGGSSSSVALERVAEVGQVVELRRPGCRRAAPAAPRAAAARAGSPPATGGARPDRAGPAVPSAARADQPLDVVHRPAACRAPSPRSVVRNANSSTASSRSWIRSSDSSGRSSQARSSRPPIDVTVRSISCEQRPGRAPPSADSITFEVPAAWSDRSAGSRRRCGTTIARMWARSAFCVSRR